MMPEVSARSDALQAVVAFAVSTGTGRGEVTRPAGAVPGARFALAGCLIADAPASSPGINEAALMHPASAMGLKRATREVAHRGRAPSRGRRLSPCTSPWKLACR